MPKNTTAQLSSRINTKEINYDKSDARIKQACIDAFNELEIPNISTYVPLTIRQQLEIKKTIRYVNNILNRV